MEKTCETCKKSKNYPCNECVDKSNWYLKKSLKEVPVTFEDAPIPPVKPSKSPTPDYYNYMYKGVQFDPYRAGIIYNITCPAMFHAFKKIIRAGQNKKSLEQDLSEAIGALQRKLNIIKEDKS